MTASAVASVTSAPSLTPIPSTPTEAPTATPEPLAATVNGQEIPLSVYERELGRCQAGLTGAGADAGTCPAAVLDTLIEQAAMEQAAAAASLVVTDAEVDAALSQLANQLGGPGALDAWLANNGYNAGEYRAALQADMLRARMAEQAAGQVGATAEQVHAREILVAEPDTAQTVLARLQGGADFATLALAYSRDLSSRAAGGDLGWFPRGLLTMPAVEEAAFALQPGEISPVVQSDLGYHIVQVLERDPARPLSPAAEQALRVTAYNTWLSGVVAQATVVRFINP